MEAASISETTANFCEGARRNIPHERDPFQLIVLTFSVENLLKPSVRTISFQPSFYKVYFVFLRETYFTGLPRVY
jgi:hypothetical protein